MRSLMQCFNTIQHTKLIIGKIFNSFLKTSYLLHSKKRFKNLDFSLFRIARSVKKVGFITHKYCNIFSILELSTMQEGSDGNTLCIQAIWTYKSRKLKPQKMYKFRHNHDFDPLFWVQKSI